MKERFIPNHLVLFLCGVRLRLDEQEALFARVHVIDLRQTDAYSM